MKKIRNWIFALLFVTTAGGTILSTAPLVSASAAPNCSGVAAFLTLPAWYRGLATDDGNGGCDIKAPAADQLSNFIWHIVLNVIEIGLQLVGYISVFFIIFGGFQYMTSAGEAAGITKAKATITNAVIGLVISIASVAIVNLVFGVIFGASSR